VRLGELNIGAPGTMRTSVSTAKFIHDFRLGKAIRAFQTQAVERPLSFLSRSEESRHPSQAWRTARLRTLATSRQGDSMVEACKGLHRWTSATGSSSVLTPGELD
jgi:hypothetical protein